MAERHLRGMGLMALLLISAGQAGAAWDPRFTNPKPQDDDVVLPMPCDGAMAFRPIMTPAGSEALDDRPVRLGGTDEDTGYLDFVQQTYVLGPFGPDGHRYYLLGKYEVTVDQWKAVMDSICPRPSMGGRLPKTGISWFDAVAFTGKYSSWLAKEARDKLPSLPGAIANVRLPTEVEWEFAARGGSAVTEAQFHEPLFPIEGSISDYAWHKGAESANNKLNPVGQRLPNPVGLYDILGNAEELVLDPFHLNRVGRLHAQAGGVLTKGGSYQEPPERLRTSMRREYPYFDPNTGAPAAIPSVGLRVALSGPVAADLSRASELQSEWRQAYESRQAPTEDALSALKRLTDATTDLDVKSRLESVEAQFKAELAARNEIEGRAVRAALLNGALLLGGLRDDDWLLAERRRFLAVYDALPNRDEPRVKQQRTSIQQQIDRIQERMDLSLDQYAATLFRITDDFPEDKMAAQEQVLAVELDSSHQLRLQGFLERFVGELAHYRENRGLSAAELRTRALAP